jgi:hypothetical protein
MTHVWITRVDGSRELRPSQDYPSAEAIANADSVDGELEPAVDMVMEKLAADYESAENIIRRKWLFGKLVTEFVHPIALKHGVDFSWIHRAAYTFTSPYLEISNRADRIGSDEISLCVILAATPWEQLSGKELRWADWWSILEAPNLRRDVRLVNLVANTAQNGSSRNVRSLVTAYRNHFKNWDTTHLSDEELGKEVNRIQI